MENSTPKRDESQELDAAQVELRIKCCMRCCKAHPEEEIVAFCNNCGVFFCKKCMEVHVDHSTESLREFCWRKKNGVLDETFIKKLVTQLRERRGKMNKEIIDSDKEQRGVKQQLSSNENINEEGKDVVHEGELAYLWRVWASFLLRWRRKYPLLCSEKLVIKH